MSELTEHISDCTVKCEHKRRDFVPDVQVVFLQGSSGFIFLLVLNNNNNNNNPP